MNADDLPQSKMRRLARPTGVRGRTLGAIAILGALGAVIAFGPAACRKPLFPRPPYHEPKASTAVGGGLQSGPGQAASRRVDTDL